MTQLYYDLDSGESIHVQDQNPTPVQKLWLAAHPKAEIRATSNATARFSTPKDRTSPPAAEPLRDAAK